MGGDFLPAAEEKGSLRRCAVTREEGIPAQMVRFVISPSSIVVPDLDARLPGRGIWLSARRDVIEQASKRGVFARSARMQVKVPEDLLSQVEVGLHRRMIEVVGLARRAGQAISGFVKVREWVMQRRAAVIVHASDGSREELDRLISGGRDIPVVDALSSEELAKVFGRERVVNVALAAGGLATRLCCENRRFAGVAVGDPRVCRTFPADGCEQAGQ
ncbi:RNA-binding protein [Acetobacter fabarum]|uniref:YlxR domain-containing protein n=1 Tax=Acetobacter fabarum TaxID=483199 RepID=A0A269XY62_9PROT|nr:MULTISPECIES: RNA-binding protein [Acetobacter]MCH4025198.1 RNA-binding protein [Acetobacter fabarum]MCH4055153.1 RNA-binding protein [Acetobacter fabarum]MCH4128642.1 RNA-binding protein [Acetobacter fabarum]MCH4141853.1 RNA-binding protein [Acetobacter fabarum]MCI1243591.1 RNA-binding protein [Acetobacter fabarum]